MPPAAVLCDIEGTTSSLSFVHNVLFPLSYQRIEEFIRHHWNSHEIKRELVLIKEFLSRSDLDPDEVIELLKSWIRDDRKEASLKSIQGKIWKEAFESGKIRGHVYSDVPKNFEKWHQAGVKVCIFSSGSIEAQKLLFQYSESGDLTGFISAYFDTNTGPKKETLSYVKIAGQLFLAAEEILFLSDVQAELDAARIAKMQTTQILREGVVPNSSGHIIIKSFDEIH